MRLTYHPGAMWDSAIAGYAAWLSAGARSTQTIRLRRYWLGRVAAVHVDPWSVDPLELVQWVAGRDFSAETLRSIRASLNGFYRWAIDAGWTTVNPARMLPSIRVRRTIPKPTPDEVFDAAIARASARDRLILRLAAHAGMRREEIARARWEDLDDEDWILIRGKGGRERRVPLPADLIDELELERRRRAAGTVGAGWRYAVDPDSPYIFPGLRGGHVCVETIGRILKTLLVTHSGHTLRHRYATKILRGSRDIRATQELLGHESILTTQRYTAVDDDDLVSAAAWAA